MTRADAVSKLSEAMRHACESRPGSSLVPIDAATMRMLATLLDELAAHLAAPESEERLWVSAEYARALETRAQLAEAELERLRPETFLSDDPPVTFEWIDTPPEAYAAGDSDPFPPPLPARGRELRRLDDEGA